MIEFQSEQPRAIVGFGGPSLPDGGRLLEQRPRIEDFHQICFTAGEDFVHGAAFSFDAPGMIRIVGRAVITERRSPRFDRFTGDMRK